MVVSYNKLRKLLIDKNMKKRELGETAMISNSLIVKLGKNENGIVDVLVKISSALDCIIDEYHGISFQLQTSNVRMVEK